MPRSHPSIQRPLNILLRCVERMPCSGPLFTSQSPFFPVFVMGLVSCKDKDRQVVRNWFEEVISRAGPRCVRVLVTHEKLRLISLAERPACVASSRAYMGLDGGKPGQ